MGLSSRYLALTLALSLVGCDEVDLRVDDPSMPVNVQENAARIMIPPAGIARLYDVSNPDGFLLTAPSRVAWVDADQAISLGPIEQTLTVSERAALVDGDDVVVTTRFTELNIPIPVRIQTGGDLRICRYQVRAARLDLSTRIHISQNTAGEDVVELVGQPTVDLAAEDTLLNPIGPCALPDVMNTDDLADFDDALITFVTDGIIGSAADVFTTSLLQIAGVTTGRIELDRKTPFPNRRGSLALQNNLRQDGLNVTDDGLEVRLELGVAARRAGCAPPIDIEAPGLASTEPIDVDEIDENSADFAFALSTESLARISQGMVLSGFACRGLEDSRPPETSDELIPTEEIRLQDIGIDLDLGPWMRVASSPGALPTVRTRPWAGDVQLTWDNLSLEFYGEFLGAPVRLGQLISNARASLRPRRNTEGFVRFDVDTIAISDVRFESAWLENAPENTVLEQWAQRALLLILGEQFVLPLPFQGAAPMRVTGSAIRDNDLVLYLVFAP